MRGVETCGVLTGKLVCFFVFFYKKHFIFSTILSKMKIEKQ